MSRLDLRPLLRRFRSFRLPSGSTAVLREKIHMHADALVAAAVFVVLCAVHILALLWMAHRITNRQRIRIESAVSQVLGANNADAFSDTLASSAWAIVADPLLVLCIILSSAGLTAAVLLPTKLRKKHYAQTVADIAHDLKTPLTAIDGYLETLRTQGGALSPGAREHCISTVLRSTRSLTKLVNDLLEFTKLEAVAPSLLKDPFSLLELASDTVITFRHKAHERKIELHLDAPDSLPWARGNMILVERALTNCLDNALRYSPPGSTVTVELSHEFDRLLVRIKDRGTGIAAEELANIGKRYYRARHTRSTTSGSGLGLATVKKICELHGGRFLVQSRVNEGTTVQLDVPTATAADMIRLRTAAP